MSSETRQRPLRTIILLRVVPITAVALFAIVWISHRSIRRTIENEVGVRLDQAAEMTAEQLGRQLNLLRASVSGLAENDLIVNSIIDKEQRHYQLPVFFRSLRLPDTSFRRITMTDYAGRPIVSARKSEHIDVTSFLSSVMAGEDHFEISSQWITIASPIAYGGSPEGVLAVQYDTKAFLENFQSIAPGQRLRISLDGELLYQSQRDTSDTRWNRASRPIPGFDHLIAERAESSEISFAAMQSLNPFLIGVLIAALVAVLGAVLAASMISTRPLANMVSQIRSIDATNDLTRRVHLPDSTEFQQLSDSFNHMIETLSRKTVSLDRLTESETQLRQTNARLRRTNEELEQFANVASHDLQEPLRIVTAYCELLREDCYDALTDDGHRYMKYVIDAAKRMRTLIQDLLSYSHIEIQGKDPTKVDANDSAQVAIQQMQEEIEQSGATVSVDLLPTVDADPGQLSQMFRHLIGNAIKYSSDRPPKICIRAEEQTTQWLFRVEDNGIGIEPQYREQIFGIFKRLHRRDQYQGTGIGLAICKRIVDRLQGKIWVESELGVGSVFFIAIPKKEPSEEVIAIPTVELPSPTEVSSTYAP